MDYVWQLLKLIFILVIFVGATYFILKNMKKKQINKISPNRKIQVIDGVSIGMKEEIVLMKIGKEYIVLSLNSGQMLGLKQEEIASPQEDFDELFERENPTLALKGIKDSLVEKVMKK